MITASIYPLKPGFLLFMDLMLVGLIAGFLIYDEAEKQLH